jgi:hypothetical protein
VSKIENENVTLADDLLLVETLRDGGCCWFVDSAKDILRLSRNCPGILGGLPLRIVVASIIERRLGVQSMKKVSRPISRQVQVSGARRGRREALWS